MPKDPKRVDIVIVYINFNPFTITKIAYVMPLISVVRRLCIFLYSCFNYVSSTLYKRCKVFVINYSWPVWKIKTRRFYINYSTGHIYSCCPKTSILRVLIHIACVLYHSKMLCLFLKMELLSTVIFFTLWKNTYYYYTAFGLRSLVIILENRRWH